MDLFYYEEQSKEAQDSFLNRMTRNINFSVISTKMLAGNKQFTYCIPHVLLRFRNKETRTRFQ